MRESMNFVEIPLPGLALGANDPTGALDDAALARQAAVAGLALLEAGLGRDEKPWPVLALGGDKEEEVEEEEEDDEDDDDLDEDDDDFDDDDDDFDDDEDEDDDDEDDDEEEDEEEDDD